MTARASRPPTIVTPPLLRDRALPSAGAATDKGARGVVLVVGGSDETPGGVLLAGLAALRSGAGKLQLATTSAAAASLAIAVPEARVIPLPASDGAIDPVAAAERLAGPAGRADAVLVGTSTIDADATGELLRTVVGTVGRATSVAVDAGALPVLADEPGLLGPVAHRCVVVPNPGEAARLLDVAPDVVDAEPERVLADAVERLGCVVALRAPETLVAGPGSPTFLDRSGHPALGTSGSGDVFAGALAGLLARGAEPLDATLWAVHLHGRAGEQAAARVGGLGILARELVDELPRALVAVAGTAP